jgi:hypothetical protein
MYLHIKQSYYTFLYALTYNSINLRSRKRIQKTQ